MNKQIIILIILTILSFIFWNTIVVYPVKLFVVLLHELSHGLAAILTGGKIIKVEISYLIGGSCTTQGGSPSLIANAGYLGSILLGGLLLVHSSKSKNIKFLGLFLSLSIFLITIFYIRNSFGIIFGISFSFILFLLTFILPKKILEWILKFIGLVSCFYVLIDIKEDLFSNPPKGTDANLLYQITGINAIFWAVLWGILALIAIIFFLRKSISK
ncbi:MAG TPA: M50 family metallopeptidase [Candidatus Paceibacterota bacterium]|nr:M50 family metallopeptidase [Candidatus Paceibacterota bacterium]